MSLNSTLHTIENLSSDMDNFDLEHLRFQSGSINQSEGDEESNNDAFGNSDGDVYSRYDDSTDHRILRKRRNKLINCISITNSVVVKRQD